MQSSAALLLANLLLLLQVAQAREVEECYPSWYDPDSDESASDQCPTGRGLWGSVTWHDDMPGWQRAWNVWYGYTAFWCPYYVGALAFIMRGTREALYGISLGILGLWNEYGLKPLIKDPKPEEQCSITCGMPSGHAAISLLMFTMFFFDYAMRLDFKAPCTCMKLLRTLLLIETGRINCLTFEAFCIVWGLLLLPVPFSRVNNSDHTWEQVTWGSVEGFFWGLTTYWIYWMIAFTCGTPCKYPPSSSEGWFHDRCCNGDGCCYLVKHNITAPYWSEVGAWQEFGLKQTELCDDEDDDMYLSNM